MLLASAAVSSVAAIASSAAAIATPAATPVSAVRGWYRLIDDGSGADAQYHGSVGARSVPFRRADAALSRSLRRRVGESTFLGSYSRVAHLDLVQAHAAGGSAAAPRVWVEERRTMVLAGVPCLAWYRGIVTLASDAGGWRIARIDLGPEDLISVRYGGHQPWRSSARVAPFATVTAATTAPGPPGVRIVTVRGADRRYSVRLAREASGARVALDVTPLPGSPG